ncbi:MAG: alpha/beta fold hydrolase [Fretibacterium sp.]|nr:alpha/beta fold hydrolase [Fretibacterium sp.]
MTLVLNPDRLRCDQPWGDSPHRPGSDAFFLRGSQGRLFAHLYRAGGAGVHPTVLLLHGFPGNERNFDLAQDLRRVGFHVLTFHYAGSWGSEGVFSFAQVLEDSECAVDFLESREAQERHGIDGNRLFVVGHSMGGFAALHTAARRKSLSAAVAMAPYDFGQMGLLARREAGARSDLECLLADGAPWLNGAEPERLGAELDSCGESYCLIGLAELLAKKPLLIVGAGGDDCARPPIHCRPLVEALEALKAPVEYKEMPTDHVFSDMRLSLSECVAAWLADRAQAGSRT